MYKPLSQEDIQRIKNEKKQKQNEKKQKVTENRKHLASVRVVQRNLVFVVGLSQRLADPEVSQVAKKSVILSKEVDTKLATHLQFVVLLACSLVSTKRPQSEALCPRKMLEIMDKTFLSLKAVGMLCLVSAGPKTTRVLWEVWENP